MDLLRKWLRDLASRSLLGVAFICTYPAEAVQAPVLTKLERSVSEAGVSQERYNIQHKMLPMRDGVRLETTVIKPNDSERHPSILYRTPYQLDELNNVLKLFFSHQYVIVIQNERGSGWSEGNFGILGNVTQDAQDTLTWVATQPWSNGRVGTQGCSSPAENQLLLGAKGHPALKALVPESSGAGVGSIPGVHSQGLFYKGGVPVTGVFPLWFAPFGYQLRPKLPLGLGDEEMERALRAFRSSTPSFLDDSDFKQALADSIRQAPSHDILQRLKLPATQFETLLALGPEDSAWKQVDLITSADTGATPSLNVNGWYDIGAYESIKLFEFQQSHADQYLIMLGAAHCQLHKTSSDAKVGDRPLGDTRFALAETELRWFDRFLKGDESAWRQMPKVQVFLMGAETWLTGEHWPLERTELGKLYLESEGHANSLWGDGRLSTAANRGVGRPDVFIADPDNPVPMTAGAFVGPWSMDQRTIEARHDVLVYSTPVLNEGVAMVGDIRAVLYLSVDTPDADVTVKVVDVYPDGTTYNIQDSALRLRYRDGFSKAKPLRAQDVYKVEIGEMVTANYFGPGHRIRIEIAGSSFPVLERNMNTGGRNDLQSHGVPAHITLYHGFARESYLEFRRYTGPIEH